MAFNAKWRGDCMDCDDPILPGQRVEFDDDRNLRHENCPDSLFGGKPKPVCPRCFLEMLPRGGGWECGYCDGD